MAHWAEIDENNIVLRVIVTNNDDPNGDEGCKWVHETYGGRWIQTSYNGNFRGSFAGIGHKYDEELDKFISPTIYDDGYCTFRELNFDIGKGVMPPEAYDPSIIHALDCIKNNPNYKTIIDIGAGTGALSICSAIEKNNVEVYAVEPYDDAYFWLEKNLHKFRNDINKKNSFIHAYKCFAKDVFSFIDLGEQSVDVIIANIPCGIGFNENNWTLDQPFTAYDGGIDGFKNLIQVIPLAEKFIKPGGTLFLRFPLGKADETQLMFSEGNWRFSEFGDLMICERIK